MITLTNEDNMELMSRYADKHFDLAIVDPPYGIGESRKNRNGIKKIIDKRNKNVSYVKVNNEIKDWDKNPPNIDYFIELERVSKNQIIWGANHFIQNIPNANSSGWIVWDKCNFDNDFADCELAWSSFNNAVRQFRFMWNGMLQGKQSFKNGHIFEGNLKLHEKRIHKTQKPVFLYKWLLDKYAKKGDKILDTHLGSGSIAIACNDYDFDLTACELDTEYYEAALKRYNNHIQQIKLF